MGIPQTNIIQVVQIPQEAWEGLLSKISSLENKINEFSQTAGIPEPLEWISKEEFMEKVNIKKTLFYELCNAPFFLKTKKVNSKVYVHHSEIKRYFTEN